MNKLNTLEIWSGRESFSKVARERSHNTYTVDINPIFNPNLVGDVLDEKIQSIIMEKIKDVDVVWMSPVCTYWSLSAGNTYWNEFRMPKNEKAISGIKMMMFARLIADYCIENEKIFFIENPNGRAVWILDNQYLKRVWYCQYGDKRAKPTNIWTNLEINFKICSRDNEKCHHEKAPRGSKTGTQGLDSSEERSEIPPKLIQHIFDVIENKPNILKIRMRKNENSKGLSAFM